MDIVNGHANITNYSHICFSPLYCKQHKECLHRQLRYGLKIVPFLCLNGTKQAPPT